MFGKLLHHLTENSPLIIALVVTYVVWELKIQWIDASKEQWRAASKLMEGIGWSDQRRRRDFIMLMVKIVVFTSCYQHYYRISLHG